MMLGYHKEDYERYKIKVPLNITLEKKTSNILIAGKSGSGKSMSTLYYIRNMLHTGESVCYITDYKAGFEYELLEGCPSYASGESAIEMIQKYHAFFTDIRKYRIRLRHHYTLVIEEWFGLLTYAESKDKKLKAELMSKVAEILSVGRGLNMGIIICIQRGDSSNFAAGSRDQFQCVLNFGRCSMEQFRMLGFSGELDANPTQNYKAGQALVLIDGQESVQEIIVPYITNQDVLMRQIRYYLDRKIDIESLFEALANGKGEKL